MRIAVSAANFSHTFPATMVSIIENALSNEHEIIRLATTGVSENEKEKLMSALEKNAPDALIGISISPSRGIVKAYNDAGAPVVLIDEEAPGASVITTDNFLGGYMAGKRFVDAGKKSIAVISGRLHVEGSFNARQRFEGFLKAMAESNITFDKSMLMEVISYSYNEGCDMMHSLLEKKPAPDAVFCSAGDMAALGAVKSIREKCLKCPADVAVIGYDNIEASATSRPKLTTIAQPLNEMALAACAMVTQKSSELLILPQMKVFKPQIIIRESA